MIWKVLVTLNIISLKKKKQTEKLYSSSTSTATTANKEFNWLDYQRKMPELYTM